MKDRAVAETKGVETLVGEPKRAIVKLALPMIMAMSVQTVYNLVDAFWVSGLGADALAAVGLFFPFFFMIISISNGIGIGGGSAISRRIGARDRPGANNVATHSMVYMLIVSASVTLIFLLLARPMFMAIGAGPVIEDTMAYSNVLFGGAIIIFFANVSNALLRGEGDAKRAMLAMMLGGVINIILDPILIYSLDMGVAGAAWATLISLGFSSALLFYWLFLKKDTYVSFDFRNFRHDRGISKDIFRVGLPASAQQLSMSINMLILNIIVVGVAGTDGIAVLTTGWRITTLGVLPLLGISTAVVSVCGAAYGMRAYDKMDIALKHAIKIGIYFEMAAAVVLFLMAAQIAAIFTQASTAAHLAPMLTDFFRITWIFLPGVAHGMLSGAMFQGAGKGIHSLALTLFRTVLLTPPLAWLLSTVMGMGLEGVWWGLVIANLTGSAVSYTWARIFIKRLKEKD